MDRKLIISKWLVYLMLILGSGKILAQDVENNFQQRISISLHHKFSRNLEINFTPEIRSQNNSFSVNEYLAESELAYAFHKFFEIGVTYRLKKQSSAVFHRFGIGTTFKRSIGNFSPSVRFMLTRENESGQNNNTGNEFRVRFKLKCKPSEMDFSPFAGLELFRNMDTGKHIKNRYILGIQYRMSKYYNVSLEYKLDYFLQKYRNNHIFNLKLGINF